MHAVYGQADSDSDTSSAQASTKVLLSKWKGFCTVYSHLASSGMVQPCSESKSQILRERWRDGRVSKGAVYCPRSPKVTVDVGSIMQKFRVSRKLIGSKSGIRKLAVSSITVSLKMPLRPPKPTGTSTVPKVLAPPPIPEQVTTSAFGSSTQFTFIPKVAKCDSNSFKARWPIQPSSAAVSTTACPGLVTRPTQPPNETGPKMVMWRFPVHGEFGAGGAGWQ